MIPARDRATTLPRAIRSALNQTYGSLEVVVVDDGSTDETPEVVRGFGDERIRLHRFETPRGANAARNAGVDRAEGQFISFLDSDDQFNPGHLERVLDVFRSADGDCDGVFTSYQLVRGGRAVYASSPDEAFVTYREMLADNRIGVFSCVTVRSEVFDVVRPDETLQCWQDYDFFLRLLQHGHRIRGLDEILVSCHESHNRIGDDPERAVEGTRRFHEKHGDELTRRGLSKIHYYRGFSYARSGRVREARRAFAKSLRRDPTRWTGYLHLVAALHPRAFSLLVRAKRLLRAAALRASGRSWRGGEPGSPNGGEPSA